MKTEEEIFDYEEETLTRPEPRDDLDDEFIEKVLKGCDGTEEYMDQIEEDGRTHRDMDHFIFERVMEYVYGDNVWDWINENHA
jgi:hypothetical protein